MRLLLQVCVDAGGQARGVVWVFIHMGTREITVSPATYEPNESWVNQQARNTLLWLEDEGLGVTHVLHDRDTKFSKSFDALFKSAGVQRVRSPIQSPIANAVAESWIGSLKRECLNHFFCFSLKHLDHVAQTYASFFNRFRPHQSLGYAPLDQASQLDQAGQPPPSAVLGKIGAIRRHDLLGGLHGGLLNHDERKAA